MKSIPFSGGVWYLLGLVACLAGCSRPNTLGMVANPKTAEEIRQSLAAGSAGEGETAEAAEEATGWANLSGRFVVNGEVAAPAVLAAAKASPECASHDIFDESLIVRDGNLVGAAIYARDSSLPVNPDLETPSGDITLDNKHCRFEPHVSFVRVGQKLKVSNSDPFGHNTKLETRSNPPQNFTLPAGETVVQEFAKEESQPIKIGCSIHPWMGAWAIVRNTPYGAISNETGAFEIAKLPAGVEIEFQLWKEKGNSWSGVSLSANGEAIPLDGKGRFKLKLEPDEDVILDITVPPAALN